MQYDCNGFTEDLQREVGKNYRVVFESRNQQYEVLQYIPAEKSETCIASYKEWNADSVRDIRVAHWECRDGRYDEFERIAERQRQREMADRDSERILEDASHEAAHDLWHKTAKRVF